MDPFSISLGVITLVGFVASTIKVTSSYLSSAKDRTSSIATLLAELEALKSNLLGLDKLLQSKTSKGLVFEQTSALQSCISSCEVKLKALCKKLGQEGERRRSRLLWPLSEKEYQKAIQDLRTFSQWIQFALSVDGLSLLSRTSDGVLSVLEKQTESFRVLKGLEEKTLHLQDAIEDQSRLLQDDRSNRKRKEILNWISNLGHAQKHANLRSPRVDGTGGWFLEKPDTIVIDEIMSSVMDYEVVAFHYFDYQDRDFQSPTSVLSSVLRQILTMLPTIPQCVTDAYNKLGRASSSIPLHELEKMLLSITQDIRRAYIIIDALDECVEAANRKPLLLFLDQLSKHNQAVRLFVTSRPYPRDIHTAFQAQRQILVQAHESDLRRYLYREIDHADVQDIVNHKFASKIVGTLIDKAEGMFLLPVLQIRTILAQPTAGDIEDALSSLSQTLPGAFEETIARIKRLPESQKRLGMSILMWICHARREITVPELSNALSVRVGQRAMNTMYSPSPRVMETCCQGLVVIDFRTMAIRLAHYSIQEYLVGCSDQLFLHAEASLASICLTYLLFDTFREGPLPDGSGINLRMETYPFLSYAATYWGVHAQRSENSSSVQHLISEFFSSRDAVACANQVMQYARFYRKLYWEPAECYSTTPLHVVSHFGLEKTLHKLLDQGDVVIDEPTKAGTTALIKAASTGHVLIVRELLLRGADPYVMNWFGNALHCAAEAGQARVIDELIYHGMDPDGDGLDGHTPIACTLHNDRAAAFETLVSHGAKILPDEDDEGGLSIFHRAILDDCVDIVYSILDRKWVDPNSRSSNGQTAMHYAVDMHNTTILRKLIKAGADINARDNTGKRPLDYARQNGDEDIIRLLLERGAKGSARHLTDTVSEGGSKGQMNLVDMSRLALIS
ncbi:uncharacterized protein GIQ15_02732 [Arthroderma uncinatum]|uniref:uncharacterized protein n=1 Tax=Arthroderma uncinatum TaxID=74035 RepID=UPI00144AD5EE|nr:uncharacterized protein GIQ15_02732 [Arthroderma uncinatum]KAF3483408.1 hypothetical protein GIQ15_02732 [Arthroderma uncinatum]